MHELTFLGLMKSTNFLVLPLFLWSLAVIYFLICALTNLSYKKAAPLNWGKTSHATNTNFTSYQNGILQKYILKQSYIHSIISPKPLNIKIYAKKIVTIIKKRLTTQEVVGEPFQQE